jgi:hypothetical protein
MLVSQPRRSNEWTAAIRLIQKDCGPWRQNYPPQKQQEKLRGHGELETLISRKRFKNEVQHRLLLANSLSKADHQA